MWPQWSELGREGVKSDCHGVGGDILLDFAENCRLVLGLGLECGGELQKNSKNNDMNSVTF